VFLLVLRLRARPPQGVVGTLELWQGLGASPRGAGRARMHLAPWAVLTALALLLGALAWMGPRGARASAARTWTCLVDRSPSMGWSDGAGRPRSEAALASALEWLARASEPGDRVRWQAPGREELDLARGERPGPAWLAPERGPGGEPEWALHDLPGVLWISDRAPAAARARAGLFASGGPAVPGPIAADGRTTWSWEAGELRARASTDAYSVGIVEASGAVLPAALERMLAAWCAARGFALARASVGEVLLEIACMPAGDEELLLERDGWRAAGRGALAESAGTTAEVWLAGRTRAGAERPVVRARAGRIEVGLRELAEPAGDPALFALSWTRLLDRWTLRPAGVVELAERRAAGEPVRVPGVPAPEEGGPDPERGPTLDALLALAALLCALLARFLAVRGTGEQAARPPPARSANRSERAPAAQRALVFSAPMLLQDGAAPAFADSWWAEAALWLGLALFLAACAAALAAWAAVRRLERLRGELRSLESLPEIQRTLVRALAERDDLDLRRIEHLLIDLRDGLKRVEELLLRAEEGRVRGGDTLVPVAPPTIGERVVSRLVALGYEKIELVTPHAELEAMDSAGGDVLVEARREGALCKGRVRVRNGRIEAVRLQPAFPTFP
jgi:hypothetical protein